MVAGGEHCQLRAAIEVLVPYSHPAPVYVCQARYIEAGTTVCMSIPGSGIDEAVGQLVLETVAPLALEVALSVQAEIEARVAEADQLRRGHVECTRRHAEAARRRYLCVDLDN
jgi:putative ubiquitin-RnfH superfamily antitoxin RatB of RatAB toxin-antitoxin module